MTLQNYYVPHANGLLLYYIENRIKQLEGAKKVSEEQGDHNTSLFIRAGIEELNILRSVILTGEGDEYDS